jgi:hypothetical protein
VSVPAYPGLTGSWPSGPRANATLFWHSSSLGPLPISAAFLS